MTSSLSLSASDSRSITQQVLTSILRMVSLQRALRTIYMTLRLFEVCYRISAGPKKQPRLYIPIVFPKEILKCAIAPTELQFSSQPAR